MHGQGVMKSKNEVVVYDGKWECDMPCDAAYKAKKMLKQGLHKGLGGLHNAVTYIDDKIQKL